MRWRLAHGAGGLALWLLAASARALEAPVELQWSAPSGCPGREDVLAGVARILGEARGGTRQAVSARASVSKVAPDKWQVQLTTRTGPSEGERTVEAQSCQALADTVALILALAANPESTPSPPAVVASPPAATPTSSPSVPRIAPTNTTANVEATPTAIANANANSNANSNATGNTTGNTTANANVNTTGNTTANATPTAAPTAATTPATGPSPARVEDKTPPPRSPSLHKPAHRLAASLSAVGSVGALPQLAPGGEVALATRIWRLRFEAAGSYWASQTTAPSGSNESATFSLVSTDVRAGYVFSVGPLDLAPSLVAEADFITGSAKGLTTTPLPTSTTWVALGGGGWVFWGLTREIALRFGLEAVIPVARPSFEVTHGTSGNGSPLFEPAAVGGKGTIGLALRFL
jgi:hypothetical protein